MTKIHSGGLRGPSVVAGPGVAYPPVPPLSTALSKVIGLGINLLKAHMRLPISHQ